MTQAHVLKADNTTRRAVCGIDELALHGSNGITHVLSLVDPELAELDVFGQFPDHHRAVLRFHDIISPAAGRVMPDEGHVDAILRFGEVCSAGDRLPNILVHCHMGVSRSTAAMLTLMAQAHPELDEDQVFAQLKSMRPQAWPNSRMIRFADDALGKNGSLFAALRRHYRIQLAERPDLGRWMIELGRQAEIDLAI
jgi:predicted protein tyrosine phosphatase